MNCFLSCDSPKMIKQNIYSLEICLTLSFSIAAEIVYYCLRLQMFYKYFVSFEFDPCAIVAPLNTIMKMLFCYLIEYFNRLRESIVYFLLLVLLSLKDTFLQSFVSQELTVR